MPQREWTAGQLRRMPELRHFDRTDPLACRWGTRLSEGALATRWTSLFALLGWTIACLAAALLFFGLAVSSAITSPHPFWSSVWGSMQLIVIFGWLPGCIVINSVIRHRSQGRARRILRTELRRRGIPICIRCGYEGGDIAAPRCPECGAPAP